MGNGAATSVTRAGPPARRSMIARRVGSAIAVSTCPSWSMTFNLAVEYCLAGPLRQAPLDPPPLRPLLSGEEAFVEAAARGQVLRGAGGPGVGRGDVAREPLALPGVGGAG